MTAASNSEARKRQADPTPHTDPTAAAVRAAQAEAEALTNAERLSISAVVHQNYYMPDVFAAVEAIIQRRGIHAAFDRALLTRLQAVVAECDLAEAEARHVVDDEVYVSVGLIRYALHTSTLSPAAPVAAEGVETVETLAEVLAAHCIVGTERGQQGVTQVIPEDVVLCNTCGWLRASDYTTHLAPRIVQARAGEGALRALLDRTDAEAKEHLHLARLSTRQVRAALDPEATT